MSTERPPKKRSVWAVIRKIWVTVGLLAALVFVGWSLIAYRASGEARASLESDSAVSVMHEDGVWHFAPAGAAGTVGLVFFPGALMDPVAYAPLARAAAQAGFAAWIVGLPRRGAFGGADDPAVEARMRTVLNAPGAPAHWVVAGHSRGAVVASRVAANPTPPQGFAGLVLIGTSHPRDVDLSGLAVPVTKIVGTRDGLASPGEVEANRAKLPLSTRWIWIEGGNHSQFGWYGFQPLDRRATVDASEQRAAMIRATLETLRLAAL